MYIFFYATFRTVYDFDPEKEKANLKLRERETIGGAARDTVRPMKGIKFVKN